MIGNNSCGARSLVYGKTGDHVHSLRCFLPDSSGVAPRAGGPRPRWRRCPAPRASWRAGAGRPGARARAHPRALPEDPAPRLAATTSTPAGGPGAQPRAADRGQRGHAGHRLGGGGGAGARPAAPAPWCSSPSASAGRRWTPCRPSSPSSGSPRWRSWTRASCRAPASSSSTGPPRPSSSPTPWGCSSASSAASRPRRWPSSRDDFAAPRPRPARPPRAARLPRPRRSRTPAWELRQAATGLLYRTTPTQDIKPQEFVEDTGIPPEKLGAYTRRFEEIVRRHGTQLGFFGHAGQGCLHIRIDLNLKKGQDVRVMQAIAQRGRGAGGGVRRLPLRRARRRPLAQRVPAAHVRPRGDATCTAR